MSTWKFLPPVAGTHLPKPDFFVSKKACFIVAGSVARLLLCLVWNMLIRPRPCGCRESVWDLVDLSLPRLCRASGGKMADSTRSSSRGKLFRCLFRRFHEWECLHEWDFPLHWGWGKLAKLWLAGLVWTPRLGVPQIPSAGSWERSRYAIAVESYTPTQGDGRGLPRPRQIPSPPGGPWTYADQTVKLQ